MELEIKIGQTVILEKRYARRDELVKIEGILIKITHKSFHVQVYGWKLCKFYKNTLEQMGNYPEFNLYLSEGLYEQSKLLPKMKDKAREKINNMTFDQLKIFIEND